MFSADGGNTLINLWPAWTAIAVASLVFLNQLITESRKFASFLGPFGRKIYDRAKKRYQMDQIQFSDAIRNAVSDERKKWEDDEARALTVVEGQMGYVSRLAGEQQQQLQELSFQLSCMRAYVEYEAQWHHKLRLRLLSMQSNSITAEDIPEHVLYVDFENRCRQEGNMAWRTWGLV